MKMVNQLKLKLILYKSVICIESITQGELSSSVHETTANQRKSGCR